MIAVQTSARRRDSRYTFALLTNGNSPPRCPGVLASNRTQAPAGIRTRTRTHTRIGARMTGAVFDHDALAMPPRGRVVLCIEGLGRGKLEEPGTGWSLTAGVWGAAVCPQNGWCRNSICEYT